MLAAWGRLVHRHRWRVLVLSFLSLASSIWQITRGGEFDKNPLPRTTESGRAAALIKRELPRTPPLFGLILSHPTLGATDPAFRNAAARTLAPLREDARVARVVSPFVGGTPDLQHVSRDGRRILATVELKSGPSELAALSVGQSESGGAYAALRAKVRSDTLEVVPVRAMAFNHDFTVWALPRRGGASAPSVVVIRAKGRDVISTAVPTDPGAPSVRVWHLLSRGRGPRKGRPLPVDGGLACPADGAYLPVGCHHRVGRSTGAYPVASSRAEPHQAGRMVQLSEEHVMERRTFMALVSGGLLAAPLTAEAQRAARVWRIGTLHTSSEKDEAEHVAALERGLSELGYLAGRNLLFVNRNAGPQMGRLPELATDLVRSGVDVIVTSTNPATLAAKKATTIIPIVMTVGVEPVAAGLVASLAKPGANVTGLTFDVDATQLAAKRLEILKQLLPSVSRVAVLWNPSYGPGTLRFRGTEDAGRKLGITIVSVQLGDRSDAERAFAETRRARAEALTVLSDPAMVARRAEIIELAARHRLPAIYALREWVEDGGLISYATNLSDQWRRAARYVDKLLKGARPSELPIEQPAAFELVINLKTARALGLTIPPSLAARADAMIQ